MTWSVYTRMGNTGSRWRRRLDVDQRTSIFAVFSWSRLERIHLATSSMQVEMTFEAQALQTDDGAHRLGCHLHTDEGRDHGPQ